MVQARCFGTTGSGTPGSPIHTNTPFLSTIAWQGLSSTLPTSIFNAASKAQGIEVSFCKNFKGGEAHAILPEKQPNMSQLEKKLHAQRHHAGKHQQLAMSHETN